MNNKIEACFGALLVFIVMCSTLKSQQPSKSPDLKDTKVLKPGGKGVNPKAATRPGTSNWAGYESQPQAPYKWSWVQLQLTEEQGGQISGKQHTGPIGRSENLLTKVEGTRRGKELRFKDAGVIYMTQPPPRTRWCTNGSFIGTFGPYGALLGDWSGPNTGVYGNGQTLLVRLDYHIVIQRQQQEADGQTRSTLSLNGIALGDVYEITDKLIPAGVYPGAGFMFLPSISCKVDSDD